jgi:hypothetical protein
MPLSRFAFLRDTVRNHPVIASTTAATGGVLLGAFVAVQLLATPKLPSDSAMALATAETKVVPKPVDEIKPAPKPVAETTGSAPTGENVASADCEQQTWPHLSRVCMEEYRAKNRSARVVTTDKLDKPAISAIETQPPAQVAAPASPVAANPAADAPALPLPPGATKAAAPATVAVTPPPAVSQPQKPAPAAAPVVALVTPAPTVLGAAVAPVAATPQPGLLTPPSAQTPTPSAKSEARERRHAQTTKPKAKGEPKAPAKQDIDDDGDTLARADAGQRAFDDRNDSRGDRRSRRIVERWTERDYDVPDSRGGRRQITVIRRNSGGGLFESLFGN